MKGKRLLFVVGPTASGKTAYALGLARRQEAVVLSCDSLCVYRGMDIGTAKPTPAERAEIPHYGLDLVEPSETYSVASYIRYRDELLARMGKEGRPVIIAGGSGFYLKSFFTAVTDGAGIPAYLREEVKRLSEREGPAGLARALRELNPPGTAFAGLDWRNPRRLQAALLRCRATGKSYDQLRAEFLDTPEPLAEWEKEVICVERADPSWEEANRLRVAGMLEAGLIEETRRLRGAGFEKNPSACKAIGYRETLAYLDGAVEGFDQLAALIVLHTRQLRRKQQAWFRRQIPVARKVVV